MISTLSTFLASLHFRVLLLLHCIGGFSTLAHTQEKDTLVLKLELKTDVNTVQLPAYCGHMHWRMPFEFTVLEVKQGNYTEKTIHLIVSCPREAVEFKSLENGKVYEYAMVKVQDEAELNFFGRQPDQEYYARIFWPWKD